VVLKENMQVPLSVDVMKGLGLDTKSYNPGVELASSQHNHLLDKDAIAVAKYPALRPIEAHEQGRQERICRHEDLLDLPLPGLHLEVDKSHPVSRSISFGSNIGAEQGGIQDSRSNTICTLLAVSPSSSACAAVNSWTWLGPKGWVVGL
jgi:hypothetical protein